MFVFERSILLGFAFLFGLTACGSSEDSSAEDEATAATIAAALDVGSGVCDVDTDGDIDRLDINLIFDARNTPASGSDDPRDADGNGSINVLDARSCTIRCTEPRCAIVDPVPQSVCDGDCFPNGVAAGDVDQTSAILWARAASTGHITFEYGQDPNFSGPPEGSDYFPVSKEQIPVKYHISGLSEGTQYYYRVCKGQFCPYSDPPGPQEARGTFRTPFADGHNGLSFGVSSCWREKERPFNSIENISEQNLDFFVALGDTVYADDKLVAFPENSNGNRDRDQFRLEHFEGYSDNDIEDDHDNYFAKARASTAIYATIDDHEIINNFQGGASPESQRASLACLGNITDHDLELLGLLDEVPRICFCPRNEENPYTIGDPEYAEWTPNCTRPYINETDLYLDGLKAWQEYNPVDDNIKYGNTGDPRTAGKDKLYRYRTFGKDAAIFMLDTRSFRDEPVALSVADILPLTVWGAGRTMLGEAQLNELRSNLVDAQARGITWKFVLVPEPIQNMSKFGAGDRFEGYAYERALVLEHIRENCITNVVFISGDIHGTLANNLVYKKNFLDKKIYSSTWDISTGPAGHGAPIGPAQLGEVGLGDEYWAQTSRDGKNKYFEAWMNTALLLNLSPYIGLDDEGTYDFIRDQQNAHVPIRGARGGYSSTNTNGWTEFNIDAATQHLKVTTWGIERDKDGNEVKNIDGVSDENGELEPFIVSEFTVEARSESDISCGMGKPNGSVCALDSGCASGRCYLLFCRAKAPNGVSCLQDTDCLSEYCTDSFNPGNRTCEKKREVGETCRFDTDCVSEFCTDSFLPIEGLRVCEVRRKVGETCKYDTDCLSEYCTDSVLPGNRTCEVKKEVGETCRYDTDCVSNLYCTNENIPALRTCEVKKGSGESCTHDSDCRSNDCSRPPFSIFKECR